MPSRSSWISINQAVIDLKFDGVKDYIADLSDPSQLSLAQMISGVRALLTTVESGLKSDLLSKLPLIGDSLDLSGTFVGKLRRMVDQLETVINTGAETLELVKASVQDAIFKALGPGGVNILALNPSFHNDGNGNQVADFRDVEVSFQLCKHQWPTWNSASS